MRAQKNLPEQLKLSDFSDKSLLILDDDDPLRGSSEERRVGKVC